MIPHFTIAYMQADINRCPQTDSILDDLSHRIHDLEAGAIVQQAAINKENDQPNESGENTTKTWDTNTLYAIGRLHYEYSAMRCR